MILKINSTRGHTGSLLVYIMCIMLAVVFKCLGFLYSEFNNQQREQLYQRILGSAPYCRASMIEYFRFEKTKGATKSGRSFVVSIVQ